MRHQLGVDAGLTDAPRDELRVLRAVVDDENGMSGTHDLVHPSTRSTGRMLVG